MNTDASTMSPPPPLPSSPPPARVAPASGDKALMVLCHVSALLSVPYLFPFIVWLTKKDEADPTLANHAKEALNFHISLAIYALCCVPLIFIGVGILLLLAIPVAGLVLAIVAAVKAAEGGFYRYPLTIRLIR